MAAFLRIDGRPAYSPLIVYQARWGDCAWTGANMAKMAHTLRTRVVICHLGSYQFRKSTNRPEHATSAANAMESPHWPLPLHLWTHPH